MDGWWWAGGTGFLLHATDRSFMSHNPVSWQNSKPISFPHPFLIEVPTSANVLVYLTKTLKRKNSTVVSQNQTIPDPKILQCTYCVIQKFQSHSWMIHGSSLWLGISKDPDPTGHDCGSLLPLEKAITGIKGFSLIQISQLSSPILRDLNTSPLGPSHRLSEQVSLSPITSTWQYVQEPFLVGASWFLCGTSCPGFDRYSKY